MKNLYLGLFSMCSIAFAQNPLLIPDTLSGSVINLSLQTGTVQFYPQQVTNTYGVNGNILGPTLLMRKNFSVTVNVANNLPDTTTIHWHGMHVSPTNDGGPHITIAPGSTWSPSFNVKDWACTPWYHPHLHEHTNEHVQKGIAGFIIVRDSIERLLNLPRTYGVDDFPMAIQTKAFDANKQIVVVSALDTALMVNATLKPFLNVPAQVVRMRLLNGASERTLLLGFTGNTTFYQIASDGGLLSSAVPLTRLRLSPGERAEILLDFGPYNGQSFDMINFTTELPSGNYGAPQPGMGPGQTIPNYSSNPLNTANYNVIKFNVQPANGNPVTTIPTTLVTHNPWPQTAAVNSRTLTFMPMNMGPTAIQGPFMIDNQMFDMNVMNQTIPLDNIEIWTLRNQTPISHPFHIHDVHFYVLDINGVPPAANLAGRKDVILVPAGNGTVRFITKFETYCDDHYPYMYHCHMLTHEDDGMMGQFLVTCPLGTGIAENVTDKDPIIFPNPGQNMVNISLENAENAPYFIQDAAGKTIQRGHLTKGINKIDISALSNGIYIIKTGSEQAKAYKLIKN
jgi:blue copper oxidase